MAQKTNIYLTGKLGKKFGEKWSLCVSSPAEALHAIDINTKGAFFKYLGGEAAKKCYRVAIQSKDNLLGEKELSQRSGSSDIYVMPTVKGKSSGWGKIIVGAILVIVGVLLYAYGGAYLINIGIGLMLGGVAQLLTPVPKISAPDNGTQLSSNIFQGNAYSITQGIPVPVVYGKALVSPLPICISFLSQDKYDSYSAQGGGTTDIINNPIDGSVNDQYSNSTSSQYIPGSTTPFWYTYPNTQQGPIGPPFPLVGGG